MTTPQVPDETHLGARAARVIGRAPLTVCRKARLDYEFRRGHGSPILWIEDGASPTRGGVVAQHTRFPCHISGALFMSVHERDLAADLFARTMAVIAKEPAR